MLPYMKAIANQPKPYVSVSYATVMLHNKWSQNLLSKQSSILTFTSLPFESPQQT